MYLFSLHVLRSYDHFYIHCILLSIYMMMNVFYLISRVVSFLFLYTCFFFYTTCLCFTLYALINLV